MLLARCVVPGFLALAVALVPVTHAEVRVNELLPGPASDWNGDGATSSRDDEWVEIVNTGPGVADLSSLFLTDAGNTPRYAFTGLLATGERIIVFGGDAYDWERANGFPAFGLSLGNTGDEVKLWQVAAGETLLVDSVIYPSHAAAADRAIGRVPDGGETWVLLDGLNPYSGSAEPGGSGCQPTPDAPNGCDSTPTRGVSWGGLKKLYGSR